MPKTKDKSRPVATNRFLERLKEKEVRSPPDIPDNTANTTNKKPQPTKTQPQEPKQTLSYTQRPYRITDKQFTTIEYIRRHYNADNTDKPALTKDEIARIMHELLIEQKNHDDVLNRLRPKASYPKTSPKKKRTGLSS